MAIRARRRRRARQPWWVDLPSEQLLEVRLCDLGLRIEGTALQRRVDQLHRELDRAGLRYRPYVWLSTDWLTPDDATGFTVPFYLAHPRLVRLEHAQMFEAEGSSHDWCMKLLRHEAGHAIDNAYHLHRRSDWRRTFGAWSAPYRSDYQARPYSRDYVQHLGSWYAQSHPAEDYAESFAVWLTPGSRWHEEYEGWPALHKLEALDTMLDDIRGTRPALCTRTRQDSLPTLRQTLREYYDDKKAGYAMQSNWNHDQQLRRLFAPAAGRARRPRATAVLRSLRVELRNRVASMTGRARYVVDQAFESMLVRCREQDLRLSHSLAETRLAAAILLTVATLNLSRGRSPRFRR